MKDWQRLLTILSLITFYIINPKCLAYSDSYVVEKLYFWFFPFVVFGIIPYQTFKILVRFNFEYEKHLTLALSTVFLGIPIVLFQDYIKKNELIKNGEWTQATVIEATYNSGKNYSPSIVSIFYVSNKKYKTNREENLNLCFKVGDTLDIIYHKKYPKMNMMYYDYWTPELIKKSVEENR